MNDTKGADPSAGRPLSPGEDTGRKRPLRLLFPGSFDPFTKGHRSIVVRALSFADEVVVAIGANADKRGAFPPEERKARIERLFADNPRVKVDIYYGLTTDYARQVGAHAILRGARYVRDFEYERSLADINRALTGIETIILMAEPQYASISSSVVRELMAYGQDVSPFLP